MSSQPNETSAGNLPRVHLSINGELVVSAIETFRTLWNALGVQAVPPLEVLLGSSPRAACYLDKPAPARHQLAEGQLSPSAQRLTRLAASPVAEAATGAGCPTITWRIWSDEHRATYADEHRTIEVLRVEAPFNFTIIDPAQRTDAAIITTGLVDAADYLVASVGVGGSCVRKVGRVDPAPSSGELAAQAAFAASAISASCSRCRQAWLATDGLVSFHPIETAGPAWALGEVGEYGLVTCTVPCVLDCVGRISFRIADLQR